jgi:hypothetical protein
MRFPIRHLARDGTTAARSQCEHICDPAEMVCIAPMDAGPLACALTLQL